MGRRKEWPHRIISDGNDGRDLRSAAQAKPAPASHARTPLRLRPIRLQSGIERARDAGGLLHHLLSVRTSGFLRTLKPKQLAAHLSGLIIAHAVLRLLSAA